MQFACVAGLRVGGRPLAGLPVFGAALKGLLGGFDDAVFGFLLLPMLKFRVTLTTAGVPRRGSSRVPDFSLRPQPSPLLLSVVQPEPEVGAVRLNAALFLPSGLSGFPMVRRTGPGLETAPVDVPNPLLPVALRD